MATYRKRGDRVQAIIRKKGVAPITKTFATKGDAEQWANDIERRAERGGMLDFKSLQDTTVGQLLQQYRTEVSEHKKGWKFERDRIAAYLREDWSHLRLCDDISGALRLWRDRRLEIVKPQSFNRDLNLISAVFTWGMTEAGLPMETNPCSRVKRPKEVDGERDVTWSDADLKLFCDWFDWEIDKAPNLSKDFVPWVLWVARKTGMRRGEICSLETTKRVINPATGLCNPHIDLSIPAVYLPDTKNGDAHTLPLSRDATQFLANLLAHRKGHTKLIEPPKGTISTYFSDARRELVAQGHDVAHLRLHDQRHTWTSEAVPKVVDNGGDQLHMLKITGRHTLASLARYFNPKSKDLAKLLD